MGKPGQARHEERQEAVALCPSCLTQLVQFDHFCGHCGCPVSVLAAIDPLMRTYAQGWLYRRAISSRPRPIVTCGMVLIFGPAAIFGLVEFFQILSSMANPVDVAGVALSGFITLLNGAILYRLGERHYKADRFKRGYCEECGYNLRGLTSPRCPECGTNFDPNQIGNWPEE